MKKVRLFLLVMTLMAAVPVAKVNAQCAACTASVESSAQNGDKKTSGLNMGIMLLLAAPYLATAAAGYIWYKKYRRKNVDLNIRPEKLNLN